MKNYVLKIELQSDTTFGRGDGVAGLVDSEVQHDHAGLPIISGRALKGLLVNECAEILFALRQHGKEEKWLKAAEHLFGVSGDNAEGGDGMFIGDATLAPDLAAEVRRAVVDKKLSRDAVLESLTTIRQQTAVDPERGAPKDETLRSMRVILQGQVFYAPLYFEATNPNPDDLALLAACAMSLRRAGTGRTRGRGKVCVKILEMTLQAKDFNEGADKTEELFKPFEEMKP